MTLEEFQARLDALLELARDGGLDGADRFEVAALLEERAGMFVGEDE